MMIWKLNKINTPRAIILTIMFFMLPWNKAIAGDDKKIQDRFFYGYCIHLGFEESKAYASGPDVELKLAQLGANSTRDDLFWDIQKATSLHDLPPKMHKIAYSLTTIPARPVLILTGNSYRIPEGQPSSDKTRKIYADYANHAAKVLKDVNPIFEIWNEWNLGAWNKEKKPGPPNSYVELAKATYPAIKRELPNGIVLAGVAGADKDWAWTLEAVRLGLMNYADGLTVHAYDFCMPAASETGVEVLERLKILHNKLKEIEPNREIPIYLTETGWMGEPGICKGQEKEKARDGMARTLLVAPSFPWLKGVWFYDLIDDGEDPKNREHHFGMYRLDGSLKPVGCAAKTVWDFISSTESASFTNPAKNVSMVSYKMPSGKVRVALWKTKKDRVDLFFSGDSRVFVPSEAKIYSLCGVPPSAQGGVIELAQTPLMFEIPREVFNDIKFYDD